MTFSETQSCCCCKALATTYHFHVTNRNCTSISVWQEWKWAEEMGNDTLSTHRSYHLKDVDESFKTSLSRISLSILILHCAQCQTLFQIHEETESTRSPPNHDDRNHPFECSTGHQLLPLAWILAKLNYCSHQNTPTFPTFPTFQKNRCLSHLHLPAQSLRWWRPCIAPGVSKKHIKECNACHVGQTKVNSNWKVIPKFPKIYVFQDRS